MNDITKRRDLAEDTFLRTWPTWVRWLLFLPSAVVVPLVVIGLMNIVSAVAGSSDADTLDLWAHLGSAAVLGASLVMIAAYVAPARQFEVALVMLVLTTLLGARLAFLSELFSMPPALVIAYAVVMVVAAASATIYIRGRGA